MSVLWLTPTPHLQAVALTLATGVALFPGDRQDADTADDRIRIFVRNDARQLLCSPGPPKCPVFVGMGK